MWYRSGRVVTQALAAVGWPRAPTRPCLRPPPTTLDPDSPPAPSRDTPRDPPKDYSVPNSGWSESMLQRYQQLLAMAASGAWARIPSYRRARHHLLGRSCPGGSGGLPAAPPGPAELPAVPPGDTRLFLRAIEVPGAGFEYAMFLNAAERRLLCLFQPGPYLEGHPGLTHGGAIAAILDATLGTCALAVAGKVMTANLSIDYLAPVPLGTVLLVEAHTERMEGRKVFLCGHVRGADGDTLHARATGLFIRLDPTKHKMQEENGGQ